MPPRKIIGKLLFLLLLACVIAGGAIVIRTLKHDPIFEGKRLSTHLLLASSQRTMLWPIGRRMHVSEMESLQRKMETDSGASKEALERAGKLQLLEPIILSWLAKEPKPWAIKLHKILARNKINLPSLAIDHKSIALEALAFARIPGTNVISVLMHEAAHTNRQIRSRAMSALYFQCRQNIEEAEPIVRFMWNEYSKYTTNQMERWEWESCMNGLDDDFQIRAVLALERMDPEGPLWMLPRSKAPPERIIPLLREYLKGTNTSNLYLSAEHLGKYGKKSAPALPELQPLLNHRNGRVRVAASEAIAAIQGSN